MVGLITDWLEQVQAQHETAAELPEWLQIKRHAAMQQLKTLRAPSRKLESWRYADVSRLTKSLEGFVAQNQAEDIVDGIGDSNNAVVIIIDESGYTGLGDCPEWLEIKPLAELKSKDWYDCSFSQETVVNLANSALFHTGGLINVKATSEPVHIQLVYAFDDINEWQYVRNQIHLAAKSNVHITERHQTGRINTVNVYKLDSGAELNRQQTVHLSAAEQFVSFNQFELSEQVHVRSMSRHLGGSLQHHCHTVNFNGEGSLYQSGSINKSFNNNNISDIVNVNHNYKNNQSDVTHRSIAKDQSQIYNNAKALVAVGADQSEIEQDLKNILLSPDAKIFSKPELEVYADEVVAAHGSTIGALDEQSLFYLQSRGISLEQSRAIMIESFEQEAMLC